MQSLTKPQQPCYQPESISWLDTFFYDNKTFRNISYATLFCGVAVTLINVIATIQMDRPEFIKVNQYTTFCRIWPLHTNPVKFAFMGNGIFMGVYYSLQRLRKT